MYQGIVERESRELFCRTCQTQTSFNTSLAIAHCRICHSCHTCGLDHRKPCWDCRNVDTEAVDALLRRM